MNNNSMHLLTLFVLSQFLKLVFHQPSGDPSGWHIKPRDNSIQAPQVISMFFFVTISGRFITWGIPHFKRSRHNRLHIWMFFFIFIFVWLKYKYYKSFSNSICCQGTANCACISLTFFWCSAIIRWCCSPQRLWISSRSAANFLGDITMGMSWDMRISWGNSSWAI